MRLTTFSKEISPRHTDVLFNGDNVNARGVVMADTDEGIIHFYLKDPVTKNLLPDPNDPGKFGIVEMRGHVQVRLLYVPGGGAWPHVGVPPGEQPFMVPAPKPVIDFSKIRF